MTPPIRYSAVVETVDDKDLVDGALDQKPLYSDENGEVLFANTEEAEEAIQLEHMWLEVMWIECDRLQGVEPGVNVDDEVGPP